MEDPAQTQAQVLDIIDAGKTEFPEQQEDPALTQAQVEDIIGAGHAHVPTMPTQRQGDHVGNFAIPPPTSNLPTQVRDSVQDLQQHNQDIITLAAQQATDHVDPDGDLNLIMPGLEEMETSVKQEEPSELFSSSNQNRWSTISSTATLGRSYDTS